MAKTTRLKRGQNLTTLTRKKLRKQKRAAKSARKAAHFSRRRHRGGGEDAHSTTAAKDKATADKLKSDVGLRRKELPSNLVRSGSGDEGERRQKGSSNRASLTLAQSPTSATLLAQSPTSATLLAQSPRSAALLAQSPTSATLLAQSPRSAALLAQSPRSAALLAANRHEEREIKKLEKLLKLKTRKSKKLPASFKEEGLDYLLDLVDRDSNRWNLSDEEVGLGEQPQDGDSESGDEPEETETRVSRSWKASQRRQRLEEEQEKGEPQGTNKSKKTLKWKKLRGNDDKMVESGVPAKKMKKKRKTQVVEGPEDEVGSSSREGGVKKGILRRSPSKVGGVSSSPSPKKVRFSLQGLPAGGSDADESDTTTEDNDLIDPDLDIDIDFDHDFDAEDELDMDVLQYGSDTDSSDSDDHIDNSSDSGSEVEWGEDKDEGEEEQQGGGVAESAGGWYVPPHLGAATAEGGGADDEKKAKQTERLRKKVQGLINRLSESNMQSVSSQLEQLYRENSRNDMNATLTEVLLKACVSPVLLANRFALEHTMLVAILHSNVGSEVGAYIVQTLAEKLDELLHEPSNYGRGKECDCIVLLIAHLYNYKVIHCLLVYDIIRRLVDSFTERDVELLLLLLKNSGMEIRRDDATSLKDIILQIQAKAATSSLSDSSRMRFMLDTISALRTNNARKIPNYDPSLLEHMRKLLRGLVRSTGPTDEGQLKVSLQDLLDADKQGRWWIVGSAWSGRETNATKKAGTPLITDSWVLDLARKQRMNTDIRKNIFCVLMTSEDCVDAFEKLLRLGLKDSQEREIVHVLVDCCLQEREYNPYYAFLGQKFCELKRSHQVTVQYALWDRFKVLDSLTPANRSNLCRLCVHLLTSKSLSLAILRVVEFAELDKTGVRFYKSLLHSLLCDYSEATCRSVFARLAPLPHLKSLRDELVVFMRHFLKGRPAPETEGSIDRGEKPSTKIGERIRIAELAMRTV